jgi:Na+/proline symporter
MESAINLGMDLGMSLQFKIIAFLLVIADVAFCIYIGNKSSGEVENTEDYFINGKKTGSVLLALTVGASVNGAGNFIGQAGRGASMGISAYWLWIGEILLGMALFGYLLAPYLARFKYISMPHYIANYLYGGDKTVRRVSGVASLLPNLLWPGGQIMGLAYVVEQVFGINYMISVLISGVIFTYYTVKGGLKSVIYTDALHGVIEILFAVFAIFFGLKAINFDFAALKQNLIAINPDRMNLFAVRGVEIFSTIFVGFLGCISNPILWNRAFAAKDVKSARQGYGFTTTWSIFMIFFIIVLGLIASTFNVEANDKALVWLILNKMPSWLSIIIVVSVLAATLSTADTHLNCAAANIVKDIMYPGNELSIEEDLKYSKLATLISGIIATGGALVAPSIFDLALIGYTICGGVLIPMFVIGIIYRDRTTDEFKSKLSIKAGRIGISVGIIFAMAFEFIPSLNALLGGGIIPSVVATTATLLISNLIFKGETPINAPKASY